MEWKNDILSFSGFDYGVSRYKIAELQSERDGILDVKENSLEDSHDVVKKEYKIQNKQKGVEQNDGENSQFKECEFDAMAERKIENCYFQNVEQAERKMKQLTILKSRWSEPWRTGEEIVAKTFLKPKNHENPWKDGTIQEKEAVAIEKNKKKHGMCILN